MGSVALHAALIWHDEVMHDLVVEKPRRITLGRDGRSTFTIPDLGLPRGFAILRPGNRGFVLTVGARMRGTICVEGRQCELAPLIAASPDGFAAMAITTGDWGVIELDDTGHHKLFFQFVPVEEPVRRFTRPVVMAAAAGTALSGAALTLIWSLNGVAIEEAAFRGFGIAMLALVSAAVVWSLLRKDSESMASLAFSVVLHTALLFMTYQLYSDQDPFAWPGLRSLAGPYTVVRLEPEPPSPPAAPAQTVQEPIASAAEPAARGSSDGGGGHRAAGRDRAPAVQFLTPRNRKTLDTVLDHALTPSVAKFMKLTAPGSFPPGQSSDRFATRSDGGPGDGRPFYRTTSRVQDTFPERPATCTGPGCRPAPPRGVISVLPPSTDDPGGLTEGDIDAVVKTRAGLFRACYQRVLDHKPGIAGKLVVHFRIGSDGLVAPDRTSFTDASTLHDSDVERCVASNINRLKFPGRGGIANVNYPFVFTQGK